MAVFRVEKTKGYTVMSNHHLRNKALSLKAKGLLSQMLSLPEEWDYTLSGLAQINKESIDAIRTAIWELEHAGYIVRTQGRDSKGKMTAIAYTIYEEPQLENPTSVIPILENPTPVKPLLENPTSDNPTLENPMLENPMQLNKDILSTELSNTDDKIDKIDGADSCREVIRKNIEYPWLVKQYGQDRVDEIVELMVDTIMTKQAFLLIEGARCSQPLVRERYLKLTSEHIQYVFDCLDSTTTKIRNIKAYLRTTLYNAPTTLDSYYRAEANHDFRAMH